ncbi:MAG: type VII secretion-associated serine protease mycosin [Actinobacteria bacterium]|nr:MAG: type VII secretion-associated serine protease mycosin [Actinomycetota bacterium]
MGGVHRLALVLCAATLAVVWYPGRAGAVVPGSPECRPPQNHHAVSEVPWQVSRYDPQRIWPVSTGAGVKVAVIDSGVDGKHPQLQGKVLGGLDLLDHQPAASFDCIGHGTGVASLIAARPRTGVGFVGLAPGVTIVPVRVSERIQLDSGETQGAAVDLGQLASAIDFAVSQGAKVINMSIYQFVDDARVRAAVANARRQDVVVVAAVGNGHTQTPGAKDRTPYPAGYDGVVGVGSIDESGARAQDSPVGAFVDLVAPGVGVTVAANLSGDYWAADGTSFAAPQVAAAAALVRARWPSLTADQVVRRLLATADPVRGGPRSNEYGYGEVDPFRAVNETNATGKPVPPPPLDVPDRADQSAAAGRTLAIAGTVTAGAVALAVFVLVGAWVLATGRRRRWVPGATPVLPAPEPSEAGMYDWSLGPPPVLANPDRAVTEELARQLRQRRQAQRR